MRFYSYEECVADAKILVRQIRDEFAPEVILGVSRGGLALAQLFAEYLDTRLCFSLNSIHYEGDVKLDEVEIFNIPELGGYKRVIVVDDMVDSGESMVAVMAKLRELFPQVEFKLVTIFYKDKSLIKPDFCVRKTDEWIHFCWEVEL